MRNIKNNIGQTATDSEVVPFATFGLNSGGSGTLYLGDCLSGLESKISSRSVDLVVTSPPYNIGVKYGRYNDRIPRSEYLGWMEELGKRVSKALSPHGSFFLNIGAKPTDPWIPFEVALALRNTFVLQNTFHWIKSIYIENDSYGERSKINVGHFKPINSKRYVNDTHEYIFHFTHTGNVELDRLAVGAPYRDASNITRWKHSGGGLRCRGNNWYIPYKTIKYRINDRPHPASFPPQLTEMCAKIHGVERISLMMDPFLGIGSSALTAAYLNIPFAGFDIDENYLEASVQILRKAGVIVTYVSDI